MAHVRLSGTPPATLAGARDIRVTASDVFRLALTPVKACVIAGARPATPTKSDEAPVGCPAWIHNNRDSVARFRACPKEGRAIAHRNETTAASVMSILCRASPPM